MQLSTEINAQYVYLENGRFKLNGENYYPMVLNYSVQIRKNDQNQYWVTPTHCYSNTNEFVCNNKSDCLNEIKAQFQMVKDMGFNTIRLIGLTADYNSDFATNRIGKIYMTSALLNEGLPVGSTHYVQEEITPSVQSKLFSYISDVLNVAEDRGIKVILLCGGPDTAIYRDKYADYLEALAFNFKNNTTLLGFDLFNEPTYASKMQFKGYDKHNNQLGEGLNKSQICEVVSGWINRMKAVNSNHLITVGFASSEAVCDWDPELISVDFASFHPYGSHGKVGAGDISQGSINIVGNELYWYGKNIQKPWIIGETSIGADNISVSYEEQRKFANVITRRCIDCGGEGFSWWGYKDVYWGTSFLEDYNGLLSHYGTTSTTVNGLSVQGTLKPAVDEFKNFSSYTPTYNCSMYTNYYNVSSFHKSKVSGKIVNSSNNLPINNAVIYGRDSDYNVISSTFSKSDGTFELYTDSDRPISMIKYSYLKMDYVTEPLPDINNSNPTSINDVTKNIGQSKVYNSQNSVTASNLYIKGDGTNGGSVTINAPLFTIFKSGTKVEKGGKLFVSSNRVLTATLKLTPLNSCNSPSKSPEKNNETLCLSLTKEEEQNTIIYPNPTNGILNIQMNTDERKTIELFDTLGKIVYTKTTYEQTSVLDISSLLSGIYILRINTSKGFQYKKIIRE